MVNTSVAGGVIDAAEREIAYCPFFNSIQTSSEDLQNKTQSVLLI